MRGLAWLLIALGITLVAMANSSISTPVTTTYSFGNHLSLNVPDLVEVATGRLMINATNVTAYVEVVSPNGEPEFVNTPHEFQLYPGNWEFRLVSESYYKEVTKVVNVTVRTECGNVTTQKAITYTGLVNTTTPIENVTLVVTVYKMGVIGQEEFASYLGVALAVVGLVTFVITLRKK